MADTTAIQWIYPPHMEDGDWAEKTGNSRVVVRFTGTSDGTGETNAVKVDLSDLKTHSGTVPKRTAVEWVEWKVFGMAVNLSWDRAPRATIVNINDIGYNNGTIDEERMDWSAYGGYLDPGEDDGTGDIILTSSYAYSGDSYDITMCLRLKD